MSDSDLSDAPSAVIPPASTLEKSLRSELRKAAKVSDDYSVKSVREASENSLGLDVGFYKAHDTWNARSKEIIKDELEKLDSVEDTSSVSKAKANPKTTKKVEPKKAAKRKSPDQDPPPRKKAKKAKSEPESEELSSPPGHSEGEAEETESEVDVPKKSKKRVSNSKSKPQKQRQDRRKSKQDQSDAEDTDDKSEDPTPDPDANGSESEMSVLLDDEPPKQRSKKSDSSKPKSTSSKPKSFTTKSAEPADPLKEEIKTLQSQLVKCGVRKVWGKELKPYETSKSKISHLKSMLSDIGMTGRFSNEKAAAIKEARELAADIEAVKEGAERWGKSEDGSGDDDGKGGGDGGERTRSGRRVVRGATNYDFLSSDGEETD